VREDLIFKGSKLIGNNFQDQAKAEPRNKNKKKNLKINEIIGVNSYKRSGQETSNGNAPENKNDEENSEDKNLEMI